MFRIFSDQSFVPPGVEHTVMLYPFWGNPAAPVPDVVSGDYAQYMKSAAEFLVLTSLEDADVAVLPFAWESVAEHPEAHAAADRFVRLAADAGKPVAVFFFSDSDAAVPLEATVFRTSVTRSSRGPREFALPAWNEDIVAAYWRGQLPVRPRPAIPVVGFCGRVPRRSRFREMIATIVGRDHMSSNRLRARALDAVRGSRTVQSRIIEHPFFFGDVVAIEGSANQAELRRCRHEFVDNMLASDYALCIRGVGNYSFRLYEALCCGRVPVIIDTDVVLPFDREIDWRSYGVWIRPDELDEIGDRVAAFNAALSDRAFIDVQHECRRLWQDRLSPEGFFRNFHHHFPCAASPA